MQTKSSKDLQVVPLRGNPHKSLEAFPIREGSD